MSIGDADVPLRVGKTCPLTIDVPDQPPLFVVAVTVRWVRGYAAPLDHERPFDVGYMDTQFQRDTWLRGQRALDAASAGRQIQ